MKNILIGVACGLLAIKLANSVPQIKTMVS